MKVSETLTSSRRYLLSRNYITTASFILIALYCLYIITHPFAGYNYNIYKQFAQYANAGHNVFDPNIQVGVDARYLDFTPASLALYKVLFYIQDNFIRNFYYAYQIALCVVAAILSRSIMNKDGLPIYQQSLVFAVLALSPAWLILTTLSGEDKALYAAGPLLVVWLYDKNMKACFLVACLFAGLSAFGVIFLPLLMIAHLNRVGLRAVTRVDIAVALCGLAIAAALLLLYFPDSKIMYSNRSARELGRPFWYSLWLLSPIDYSPAFAKAMILIICSFSFLMLWLRRTSLPASLMSCQFAVFILANFINHNRIVSFIFIPLLFLRARMQVVIYAVIVFVQLNTVLVMRLAKYRFPDSNDAPFAEVWPHVVLTNAALGCYLLFFFWNSLLGRRQGRGGPSPARLRADDGALVPSSSGLPEGVARSRP